MRLLTAYYPVLDILLVLLKEEAPISDNIQECLDNCEKCQKTCLETLEYCREKGGGHAAREHLQLLEECAIACEDLAESLKRQPEIDGDKSLACADICERCAENCEQFEDDEQMQECAEICRECAAACQQMTI